MNQSVLNISLDFVHRAQHCLPTYHWKVEKCLDDNGAWGTLLIDLPKAFGCLSHSLLIAKLHAYGFNITSTEYLKDYLSHRKQKIKINKTCSNWTNILHGVPQGSILGPLLFNVFLCDLFLFISNIDLVSYADDNTPFAMGGSSELEVINEIKSVVESLTLWFRNNCMKVNPDKFHLLLSDKKVITWIFVMRSFQVRAVKSFSGLKLIISLLLKNT